VDQIELPNKLYFRIGEVAKIIGVKPYVLRYWETEFTVLKPGKTPSRHRLYRRRDVETLLEIKRLLYEEGFTIAGAKKRLKELEREEPSLPESSPQPQHENYRQILQDLRQDLYALYQLLNGKSSLE
jgi:DNA-binding transcriptional MerR regulator